MYKKGTGNDKQGKDAGNRTLCPYRNFSQAITQFIKCPNPYRGKSNTYTMLSVDDRHRHMSATYGSDKGGEMLWALTLFVMGVGGSMMFLITVPKHL